MVTFSCPQRCLGSLLAADISPCASAADTEADVEEEEEEEEGACGGMNTSF